MSLNAAVLRKMLDKGLTLEDAVELAEIWEAGSEKPVSSGALRARRYRERKAESVTNNVTRHVTDNAQRKSPEPPKKTTPFPPLKGGTSPKAEAEPSEKPTSEPVEPLKVWVNRIWELSPARARERSGRRDVERALDAAIRRGQKPAAIAAALEAYFATKDARKNDCEFVKGTHRMIEADRWQAFAVDLDATPPPSADPWPGRLREFRRNGFWNTTDWGPKPGKPGCLAPESQAEIAA